MGYCSRLLLLRKKITDAVVSGDYSGPCRQSPPPTKRTEEVGGSPSNVIDATKTMAGSMFSVLIKAVDKVTREENSEVIKRGRVLFPDDNVEEEHERPTKKLRLEPNQNYTMSQSSLMDSTSNIDKQKTTPIERRKLNKHVIIDEKVLKQTSAKSLRKQRKEKDATARIKHPDAPKRFKSPYIFFSMDKKEEVEKSLGPRAKATEVTRKIAKLWREISHVEKNIYTAKAKADKERYEKEKAAYKGPWTLPKPPRKKKDPTAPKRSSSAFLFYAKDMRGKIKTNNPNMSFQDASRLLGKMWESESDEVKQPYIEREMRERRKYNEATADWKRQQQEEAKEDEATVLSTTDDSIKKVTESECDEESCSENSSWGDGSPSPGEADNCTPYEIICDKVISDKFKMDTRLGSEPVNDDEKTMNSDEKKSTLNKVTESDKRSPSNPKKIRVGFLFFSASMRPHVMKTYPNLTFEETHEFLSSQWMSMSIEEKRPFMERETNEKRFVEEIQMLRQRSKILGGGRNVEMVLQCEEELF